MIQAWKYTLPAFLVPMMFCLTPEGLQLLMLTPEGNWPEDVADWWGILETTITSCLALVGLCVGITGYARQHATAVERVLSLLGGILLIAADARADLAGLVLLSLGLGLHWVRTRKTTVA